MYQTRENEIKESAKIMNEIVKKSLKSGDGFHTKGVFNLTVKYFTPSGAFEQSSQHNVNHPGNHFENFIDDMIKVIIDVQTQGINQRLLHIMGYKGTLFMELYLNGVVIKTFNEKYGK